MASLEESDLPLADPTVLLFETSPYGTLDAIVQHDGKSVYFYLNESRLKDRPPGTANSSGAIFGTRACWVRNLDVGPLVINETQMRQGVSPMLPRTHAVHREAQPIPVADRLQIVWLEEGNGAALIETNSDSSDKTLAVIPPWSGTEGFHGYASECAIESPLCWPMPDNPKLDQRIKCAREFWEQWNSGSNPFSELQPKLLAAYDSHFSNEAGWRRQNYFATDGGKFPPRGIAHYQSADELVLATVGMSVCPQPAVELFVDDPANHRRIELAIRLQGNFSKEPDSSSIDQLVEQLSGLAGYPWRNFTWLGAGHTCGFVDPVSGCESALLIHNNQLPKSVSSLLEIPTFRDDPIGLLWLIPITPAQQQQLQNQTLTASEILSQDCR
jgi:hypothetical protein